VPPACGEATKRPKLARSGAWVDSSDVFATSFGARRARPLPDPSSTRRIHQRSTPRSASAAPRLIAVARGQPFGPWTGPDGGSTLAGNQPEGPLTATTADPNSLFCYRHPDRETYVRCGRCDQAICPSCAMQGPVGLRCRACGKPPRDPLTTLTPAQLGAGIGVALAAGTLGGLVGLQTGFFLSLCAGPFIGGMITEATLRATGYKRGPLMRLLVVGGIVGGVLVAAIIRVGSFGPIGSVDTVWAYLSVVAVSSVVYVLAATFGGLARLR
jgi:hypothetical protein